MTYTGQTANRVTLELELSSLIKESEFPSLNLRVSIQFFFLIRVAALLITNTLSYLKSIWNYRWTRFFESIFFSNLKISILYTIDTSLLLYRGISVLSRYGVKAVKRLDVTFCNVGYLNLSYMFFIRRCPEKSYGVNFIFIHLITVYRFITL